MRVSDAEIDNEVAGVSVGELVLLGNGLLCACDDEGRHYYRAPRRSDVHLARRIRAAIQAEPLEGSLLAEDVTSVRERT